MLRFERHKDEQPKPASINDVLGMLERAVTVNVQFAKELAIRKARQWTLEVTASCSYLEPIKKEGRRGVGQLEASIGPAERKCMESVLSVPERQ